MRTTSRPPKWPSSAAGRRVSSAPLRSRPPASTRCSSRRSRQEDHRTTALLAGSVTALTTLGVWQACRRRTPRRSTRSASSTTRGGSVRAPEVHFRRRRNRARRFRLQYREPSSHRRARSACGRAEAAAHRAPRCRRRPAIATASPSSSLTARRACGSSIGADGAALDLPRRGGDQQRPARLSADRADAQSRARAAARRNIDRISHRERTVHARSPARPAFEPGLRARPRNAPPRLRAP